jgi:hypothetical protein
MQSNLTGMRDRSMKYILTILICALTCTVLESQTSAQKAVGAISYVTSQHVYVKFASTKDLAVGDTLFINKNGKLIPALKIATLSSISCACEPLAKMNLAVGDKVGPGRKSAHAEVPVITPAVPVTQLSPKTDTTAVQKAPAQQIKQRIDGRISIASYSGFSNTPAATTEKLQYTFSLNARNIGGSGLSAETYVIFVHKINEWDKVKADIFNGLKIYNLSLAYDIGSHSRVMVGRKINPKFSNMGAVDGLQYELKIKSFTAGVIAGFRPDYANYGFNSNLFEYGGFLYQEHAGKQINFQNTLAFIQQNNNGKTDRRFAYFQHSNSLLPNLNFFGSVECDLYQKVFNTTDSTYTENNSPRISNLYLSLRYRVMSRMSLSVSYSNRQNILYYETYKSYLEKLLETATQQGYLFQVNYRPVNSLTIGVNAGYRFQNTDARDSKNVYGYASWMIPGLKTTTTGSVTWIDGSYLSGKIYSLGLSRDLARGKLNAGINYRYVDYQFYQNESSMVQHIAEVNLSWNIIQKLSLNVFFEGTFEKPTNQYQRLYVQLRKSF